MKILFLGAGGVGGYFGGRLMESGADVSFLVRPGRHAQLVNEGLRIESPHGNFTLKVNSVTRETVTPIYDIVVMAPKAYDLDDAIVSIRPAAGPKTFILPLLNGLAHMDTLDDQFGRDHVLAGVAHIAAVMNTEGTIKQLTELHMLTVGGRDTETQAVADRFIKLCSAAKFNSRLAPSIENVLWEKWTFLATLAGITTLMRGSVGQIMNATHGDQLVRTLYSECLAVAAACGVPVGAPAQSLALDTLTKRNSTFTASMLRDLESGYRTEHDHILGEMLKRAANHGLATPILAATYANMQIRAQLAT